MEDTIDKAQKMVSIILDHLDDEKCEHCKELLRQVFE